MQASVKPGSTVRTDGWQAYWTLPDHGYLHDGIVVSRGHDPAHVAMPNVHRVASLLKRWLLETHQGAVQPSHLQAYLDEFVRHEALPDRAGCKTPPLGCRSSPVEAEGSPTPELRGRAGSSPDNDAARGDCRTARARQARRKGVMQVNQ